MLEFQQSETTAERRRWILVLVDSTDGVSGLTGQTGQVYVSKNGGTPALSTNSITEVDSSNMPGHYYIELTQSELDTLGFISISKKTASSLAFHDRAIVSYNDPYVSAGGFSGGGGSSKAVITNKQLDEIAKKVWEYKVSGDISAQDALLEEEEKPISVDEVRTAVQDIFAPTIERLSEVKEAVEDIFIPTPIDYSKSLSGLDQRFDSISQKLDAVNVDVTAFNKSIDGFIPRFDQTNTDLASIESYISDIKTKVNEMGSVVETLTQDLETQTDMDKRFTAMKAGLDSAELSKIARLISDFEAKMNEGLRQLSLKVSEQKFAIIDRLNK